MVLISHVYEGVRVRKGMGDIRDETRLGMI